MIRCDECQAFNSNNSEYCRKCGKKLDEYEYSDVSIYKAFLPLVILGYAISIIVYFYLGSISIFFKYFSVFLLIISTILLLLTIILKYKVDD
ncbi:MAG: hypothetical protein BZ136_00165 [Methanosphaera sp. rholeuAM74]|nr:MAG: hypothetical protein BZ136_00165 [Methanosphaera sp. rholeuAM74]